MLYFTKLNDLSAKIKQKNKTKEASNTTIQSTKDLIFCFLCIAQFTLFLYLNI